MQSSDVSAPESAVLPKLEHYLNTRVDTCTRDRLNALRATYAATGFRPKSSDLLRVAVMRFLDEEEAKQRQQQLSE